MPRQPLTDSEKQNPYAHYYNRPSAEIPETVLTSIQNKVHDPQNALLVENVNDLLLPGYLPIENGHCRMPDGSYFVAVRTEFPNVTSEMINWWFDWHPQEPLRYRIWYPETHFGIHMKREQEQRPNELPHWHTTHYPVEDIGLGKEEVMIHFVPPAEFSFDTTRFDEAGVETVICGLVGSVERRMRQHTRMCHLVRRFAEGLEMRSRFWMGGQVEFQQFLGSRLIARLVNTKFARNRLLSPKLGLCMAVHCAQEYNNLAQILPELYKTYS